MKRAIEYHFYELIDNVSMEKQTKNVKKKPKNLDLKDRTDLRKKMNRLTKKKHFMTNLENKKNLVCTHSKEKTLKLPNLCK